MTDRQAKQMLSLLEDIDSKLGDIVRRLDERRDEKRQDAFEKLKATLEAARREEKA